MGTKFEFNESIMINRPPKDVFQYAADFRNDTEWRKNVTEMTLEEDDPFKVGNTAYEVIQMYGRQTVTKTVITEVQPGRLLSFKSISGPMPITGVRQFEPVDGATRYSVTLKGELNFFFSILWRFRRKSFHNMIIESLERLKHILESQPEEIG